jgi:choline dehydrogenase-like flavoprotein
VPGTALTPAERRLRGLLYANAVLALAFIVYYVASGVADAAEFRFVVNSTAKDGLFLLISLVGAADVRRRGWLALLLAAAYGFLIVAELVMLAFGVHTGVDTFGVHTGFWAFIGPWLAVDVIIFGWLLLWWWQAERARFGLKYLNPVAFRTLIALAEVLIDGRREALPPLDVARNVDDYMARLEADSKSQVQLALTVLAVLPLVTLRMPLPAMSVSARERYLKRRFLVDVSERRWPAPLLPYVQAMIRVASQMSYLGYYGDRRSWEAVGYRPFPLRHPDRIPAKLPSDGELVVRSAPPRPGERRYDTIVIGSGAGGGILAYRLAATGRRVLVVERGRYWPSKDFDLSDEVGQYLRLYNAGALQLATDFRLQVLQGICVGGSTTVNNAVCIDPPAGVLAEWERRGIPAADLMTAIEQVRHWLPVNKMPESVGTVAARRFVAGLDALGQPGRLGIVDANIRTSCLACGDCNIGCALGQKLSSLDSILPRAQAAGDVDVLAQFKVERIVHEGGRATGVIGSLPSGDAVTVGADEVVLAAGAINSSWVLLRSGIGGDKPGAAVHFNVNSPLTAEFPDHVDAFDGLQMSHAFEPAGDAPGFVIETWFNPPATQALAMPGWFEQHFENMLRYRYMACAGVLTGTTRPGRVTATKAGPTIEYEPAARDLHRIVEGLKLLGRGYLAAGATRIMPATFRFHEFRDERSMDTLDRYVRDNADILLTTAHPQSGNAIGEVVDEDFRVRGFDNLYVTDASVFPSSVTVNPQMTVFGMAWLAANRITGTELAPAAEVRQAAPPASSLR